MTEVPRELVQGLFNKKGCVVFRNLGPITGWDVVEKPFLKTSRKDSFDDVANIRPKNPTMSVLK